MINARDAKKQSEQNAEIILVRKKIQECAKIEKDIMEAISKGKTSISYPVDIYDETANKLHEAGYSIEKTYYNNRDFGYLDNVEISWKDAE